MTRYLFGYVVVCSSGEIYETTNTPHRQRWCIMCNESHLCMWYKGEYPLKAGETVWYLD